MRVYAKCGCGQFNYNFQDWLAHFKYGSSRKRAWKYLFLTQIIIRREAL